MQNLLLLVILFLVLGLSQQVAFSHQMGPSSEPYSHHYEPYSYGYDVEDNYGNKQWRQERGSSPQEIHGSYGYRDKNGIYREVTYVADKNGFRANIKTNEPGVAGTKDPASVKMESYYSPPQPTAATVASPPVYSSPKQHHMIHSGSSGYYHRSSA